MLAKFVLRSCCRTSLSSLEIVIKAFFIETVISSILSYYCIGLPTYLSSLGVPQYDGYESGLHLFVRLCGVMMWHKMYTSN